MTREFIADRLMELTVADRTSRLSLEAAAAELRKRCEWTVDEDSGLWHTGCGNDWQFEYEGPKENKQQFCGYCGGALVVAP